MKKFKIDKQTLEELNLLGKFRSGTVYNLFNRVYTRGGEQLLDEMFNNPLTDTKAINERGDIFRYFGEKEFAFGFDRQLLVSMREYMDTASFNNKAFVYSGMIVQKVLSNLTRDDRYKKNVQGLQAVIQLLNLLDELLNTFSDARGSFLDRVQEVKEILTDPYLAKLRQTDIYQALPLGMLAFYEYLLKGKFHADMESLLNFIYEVDVYQSVAQVAVERGFHYALALPADENCLNCKNLKHPCINGAVGNDLHLHESSNVLFLTGANMAGKSTWMKSLGIGLYLAHMGFPIAADSFEFSVRDGLYSSINVADNIGLGYSHFYAEVMRVKEAAIAAASGDRLMLIFDELFKGTNVKDAYDGTLAVTSEFAKYEACLFVVSTHIIEVGEELSAVGNIQFGYMPTILENNVPRYTYRLQEGITEDRQGMMIIRNERILEMMEIS
ncbi:MAG: mismatch repair protein [Sphingobacterium sp.]|jgi:DNA mismatch repair ATPase MutS|nr:mismatch repair protein [Sphingobacterium sp.]